MPCPSSWHVCAWLQSAWVCACSSASSACAPHARVRYPAKRTPSPLLPPHTFKYRLAAHCVPRVHASLLDTLQPLQLTACMGQMPPPFCPLSLSVSCPQCMHAWMPSPCLRSTSPLQRCTCTAPQASSWTARCRWAPRRWACRWRAPCRRPGRPAACVNSGACGERASTHMHRPLLQEGGGLTWQRASARGGSLAPPTQLYRTAPH